MEREGRGERGEGRGEVHTTCCVVGFLFRCAGTTHHSITQHHAAPRSTTQHHAASRSITQHHAAPRSITQHHAAPRSTTQHHAALRSTTQHHAASCRVTCSQPIPFNLTTIISIIFMLCHIQHIHSILYLPISLLHSPLCRPLSSSPSDAQGEATRLQTSSNPCASCHWWQEGQGGCKREGEGEGDWKREGKGQSH